MTRRQVRATVAFFEDLDRQLPAEPSHGVPSRSDFQAYELLEIVEAFAAGFDNLPELIPGRPDYRILITTGRVVVSVSVTAQLAPDGAVDVVGMTSRSPGSALRRREGGLAASAAWPVHWNRGTTQRRFPRTLALRTRRRTARATAERSRSTR